MQKYQFVQEIIIKALIDPMITINDVTLLLSRTCSETRTSTGEIVGAEAFDLDTFRAVLYGAGYEASHISGSVASFIGTFQGRRVHSNEEYVESSVSIVSVFMSHLAQDSKMRPGSYAIKETEYVFNFPLRLGFPVPQMPNPLKDYQNAPLIQSAKLIAILKASQKGD